MAKVALSLDLLFNAFFLFIDTLLNVSDLLLVVAVLSFLLVSNVLDDLPELGLLGSTASKGLLKGTVLRILFRLEGVIDVSHLGVEVTHHGRLLFSCKVARVEPLLETVQDLVLHLIVLVKLAIECNLLLLLNLLLHLLVVLFFLLLLAVDELGDLAFQLRHVLEGVWLEEVLRLFGIFSCIAVLTLGVEFLVHNLVDDFVVFVYDASHLVQFSDELLDRLHILLFAVLALVSLLFSVTVFKLVLEYVLTLMELAKKVLHIFVADGELVSFLLGLFLVDLVLLLATAGEAALLGVLFVILLKLVVVERVRALFLR